MTMTVEAFAAALFPAPLHERWYLYAHWWEEVNDEGTLWWPPGCSEEDCPQEAEMGGFTYPQAIAAARELQDFYIKWNPKKHSTLDAAGVRDLRKTGLEIIWDKAARYHWLVEFGTERDPANHADIQAWAKDKLPAITEVL